MLDPASIDRLAEFPEQNDPLLNVALAEEGLADYQRMLQATDRA